MIKKSIVLLFAALLMPCGVSLGQTSYSNAYGIGVHKYFSGCHQDAIMSFNSAIAENPSDARAFYFRGLAQMGTGNACAADADFQQGASIETSSTHRRSSLVNRSLERIQGATRLRIERFRGNRMTSTPSIAGTQVPYNAVPVQYNQTVVGQEFVAQPISQPVEVAEPLIDLTRAPAVPPIAAQPLKATETKEPLKIDLSETIAEPATGDAPDAETPAASEEPFGFEAPATEKPAATESPLPAEAPAATEEPFGFETPATEKPAAVEAPFETPLPTEEPAATEKPAATDEPFGFETPATEKPAAVEAPAPLPAEEPAVTEEPAVAEDPFGLETPATEEPAATEEPFGFETPATEEPAAAEEPFAAPLPTEEPAATEEPVATEEPAAAEEPFGAETPATEEPATPAATEEPAADPADPFGAEEKPAEEPAAADPVDPFS